MDNVKDISCQDDCIAVIKTDNRVFLWNRVSNEEMLGTNAVVAVSCGVSHMAVISPDGGLCTAGSNDCGQLGDGTTDMALFFYQVMDNVAAVNCGINYTAAIKTDGTLWTWGWNVYGQLGNNFQWNDTGVNDQIIQTLPVKVLDGAAAVSCGRNHTIAVKTDGTLWTWGSNSYGQLGNGGTGNTTDVEGKPIQSVPKQITLSGGVSAAMPSTPTAPSTPSTPAPAPAGTQPGASSGTGSNPDDIIQIYLNNKNVWLESDSDGVYGDVYTYTLIDLEGDGVPELVSTTIAGGSGIAYASSVFKVDVNARKVSLMQNAPEALRNGMGGVSLYRDKQSGQLLYYAGAPGNLDQYMLLAESLPTHYVDTMAGGRNSSVNATVLRRMYDELYQSIKVTSAAPAPTVVLSPQKLAVNGQNVNCEKYNIDGSNYFKLRDLAYLLRDTGSRFSVDFDAARSTIVVKTGAAYTPVGGELVTGTDKSSSAVASAQSIEINGAKVELTAYNIGGNNFFKLRDLGTALGFEVGYDQAANTATVRSAQK